MAELFSESGQAEDVAVIPPNLRGIFLPSIDNPTMQDGFGLTRPLGGGQTAREYLEYGVSAESSSYNTLLNDITNPLLSMGGAGQTFNFEGLVGPQGIPGRDGLPGVTTIIGLPSINSNFLTALPHNLDEINALGTAADVLVYTSDYFTKRTLEDSVLGTGTTDGDTLPLAAQEIWLTTEWEERVIAISPPVVLVEGSVYTIKIQADGDGDDVLTGVYVASEQSEYASDEAVYKQLDEETEWELHTSGFPALGINAWFNTGTDSYVFTPLTTFAPNSLGTIIFHTTGADTRKAIVFTATSDYSLSSLTLQMCKRNESNPGTITFNVTNVTEHYSEATWAEATLTSVARDLMDDTTQGAQQDTLGLGTGDSPTFTGLTLSAIAAEATDVDKFLVDSTGVIKFRTGAELLSDIGASSSGHVHDGATLQHDGVNSDGGAFSFTTTGLVTFNQSIAAANYAAANLLTAAATNAGEIDFTAASKKLDVEDNAVVSQDYSSDASPTFAGLTLSDLTQGSVVFTGASSVLSQDNSNLFWDDTNNRLGIGINTGFDPRIGITVSGDIDILHTATEADDHAFEIDVDAATLGDVKAIDINYTTGILVAGRDEGIILLNINEIGATGGEIFGLEVLATDGSAEIFGMKVGAVIGPIHQDSGTFANPTTGTDDTIGSSVTDTSIGFTQTPDTITDSNSGFGNFVVGEIVVVTGATTGANNTTYTITAATAGALTVTPQPNTVENDGANITVKGNVPAMLDGSSGTTTAIFESNSDYILIGAATAFEEIEFILTTESSGAGIKPTFWYSTAGSHQFTVFTPVDGTNGFRNTGVVAWDTADVPSHGVNTDTGTYDIKIIRTRNSLSTSPILGYAKVAATTEYEWDKSGDVNINSLTLATVAAEGSDVDKFLVSSTGVVKYRTGTQVLSDIGGATSGHNHSGVYEPADAGLTSLAALTYVSDSFIKVTATDTYAIRTIAETKSDLSLNLVENTALSTWAGTTNITTLGTIATGAWAGTTIPINKGGTGQVTAQTAIDALSAVSGATNEHVLTKDTGTGNATWKASGAGAHTHDGDTLQLDGINSDGGAFPITTSGAITINAGAKQLKFDNTIAAGSDGILTIGNASTNVAWNAFRVVGASINQSQIIAINTAASSSSGGGGCLLYADDGAAMATGHRLGYFLFGGSASAAAVVNTGGVFAFADGNWTDGSSYPTKFSFSVVASGETTRTERLTIKASGYVGLSESDPVSLLEMTGVDPVLTIHNNVHNDGANTRKGTISFRGEQSGGEETLLAQVEASHHGVGDDQKGQFRWRTNAGSDGTSPTFRMILDSVGKLGLATATPNNLFHVKTSSDGGGITIQRNSVAADSYADLKFLMSTSDSTAPVSWIRCYRRTGVSDIDMHFAVGGNDALVLDDNLSITGYGTATFEGASVTVGKASTTTGTLVLHDSNSANTITLTVPDISAGSLSFTLPPTDGANTNVLQTDGNGVLTWAAAGGGVAAHAILDGSVHTDSVADAVTRGSIIYGNATPKWDELGLGLVNTFLGSDGTDLSYRTAAQVMASLSGAAAAAFDLNGQDLTNGGVLFLTEQAAAEANVAGKGQFWVLNNTPNEPWFDNDAGTSFSLDNRMLDRGDPANWDWTEATLTTDETWVNLDLSGIVPVNTKFVWFTGYLRDDAVESYLQFRREGNSNTRTAFTTSTRVANVVEYFTSMGPVPVDANRVVEYRTSNTTFTDIKVAVSTWVLG